VSFWITWQSGEAFNLEDWEMTKSRFSGANNWHHVYVTELQGKVKEEERSCYETRRRPFCRSGLLKANELSGSNPDR
jgi:hypothetical protein